MSKTVASNLNGFTCARGVARHTIQCSLCLMIALIAVPHSVGVAYGEEATRVQSQRGRRPSAATAAAPSAAIASNAAPLPSFVYDEWADPAVRVIEMPSGRYYLPASAPLRLHRSNVTINFRGCTLLVNPADGRNDGFYPIQIASVSVTSPTYLPSPDGTGAGVRTISHLTGVIAAATTQLTMDPAEIVNLASGERVIVWAGVTPSDPYEAQDFIVATVASVNAGVITFTEPLGKDVMNYGTPDALAAATIPAQRYKIGTWGSYPDDSNFAKGYGADHGLERFVGDGLIHDVTFNDLTMELDRVAPGDMPNGTWDLSAIAVQRLTLNRTAISNPHGSGIHLWRAFDASVNGYTVTGVGSSRIWNSLTAEGSGVTIWGGAGLTFSDLSIKGTDIAAFNVEVSARNIWVNRLDFTVTFTDARQYSSPPVIFGFNSVIGDVRVTDASISAITTGGSSHAYFSYVPFAFDGYLDFPGSSLTDFLGFHLPGSLSLRNTALIGGVRYGPPLTEKIVQGIVHGAGVRSVTLPQGLYQSASFAVVHQGDLRDISDSFGNEYQTALDSYGLTALAADKWSQIAPGDAGLKAYIDKSLMFWQNNNGSEEDAEIEFTVTYLPLAKAAGLPSPPGNLVVHR